MKISFKTASGNFQINVGIKEEKEDNFTGRVA
jgi:hypothetical protein